MAPQTDGSTQSHGFKTHPEYDGLVNAAAGCIRFLGLHASGASLDELVAGFITKAFPNAAIAPSMRATIKESVIADAIKVNGNNGRRLDGSFESFNNPLELIGNRGQMATAQMDDDALPTRPRKRKNSEIGESYYELPSDANSSDLSVHEGENSTEGNSDILRCYGSWN